jgi:cell wall-associated NlpC family hydrolase
MVDGRQGWMEGKALRFLKDTPQGGSLRDGIVATARLFLGTSYLWGGRSPDGVDCSGLTNLSFRASGISIPRDAHEQWMTSRKVSPGELLPADLIFLSGEGRPDAITHVMLAAGGECFIEASETGTLVRESTFEARLGLSLAALAKKRFKAGGRQVFFGRVLP